MELRVANNLLLWAAVIALSAGVFMLASGTGDRRVTDRSDELRKPFADARCRETGEGEVCFVPLVALLSRPEVYEGRIVRTIGVLGESRSEKYVGIFPDYRHAVRDFSIVSSVALDISNVDDGDVRLGALKLVAVQGEFSQRGLAFGNNAAGVIRGEHAIQVLEVRRQARSGSSDAGLPERSLRN